MCQKAKDLTVRVNEDPVAPEAISNKEELPSNTKYAWKEKSRYYHNWCKIRHAYRNLSKWGQKKK